jgi:hypothetical protein
MHNLQEKIQKRELVLLVVGSYFTHGLSYLTCLQIVEFNNNEKFKKSIVRQLNLPLYSKG